MGQTINFFRFLMPGMVFVIFVMAAAAIVYPHIVSDFLIKSDVSAGFVALVGFVVGSGGLGYIFSTIYFSLMKVWGPKRMLAWNFMPIGNILESGDKYDINMVGASKELDQDSALVVVNHLWSHVANDNEHIKQFTGNLCNVLHGLGATLFAAIFSLGMTIWIASTGPCTYKIESKMVVLIVFLVFFVGLVYWNHYKLKKHLERQFSTTILTSINDINIESKKVIKLL